MKKTLLIVGIAAFVAALAPTQTSADPHMRPSNGALNGRRIFVSPGHGYYWHNTLGWTTQRGVTHGVVEDHSNAMLMIDFIIPYLVNAGAYVVSARERSYETLEFVGDDGDASFTQTGTWTTSTNVAGFRGAGYRWASTATTESATARWTFNLSREAKLPVYVWFTSASDRAPDALYRVHHAAGVAEVRVNQRTFTHTDYAGSINTHNEGARWVFIGEWEFTPAQPAVIELSNQSPTAGNVVIADGVKLGAGMGSINSGGGTSNRARWLECSRYWAQYAGAPASVYDSIAGGQDNDDDVTCRPRLMNWWGGFDLYFAIHSNAASGTARGTVTLSYDNSSSPTHPTALVNLSNSFRDLMNATVAGDMTAVHDSTWVTRTPYAGNFGELRQSTTAPSCLLESAFHDNATDAWWLRQPFSRHTIGRAAYKAIVRQFNPSATIIPLPPTHLAMRNTGAGEVTLSWQPQTDPREASAVASSYRVYLSSDGFAFDEGRAANAGTSHVLTGLAPGQLVFARVTATNAGGESLVSEMLCARTPDSQAQGLATPLLIVSGYDRWDEFTWYQQGGTVHTGTLHGRNHFNSVRRHALAAAASSTTGGGTFFFDSASNEAVENGTVALGNYAALDWVLGNEDQYWLTFNSAEQALVSAYLAGGGRLFVSGTDIGAHLGGGSAADVAFLNNDLGAGFVNNNSGVWAASGAAGSVFAGVGPFTIDNGTGNNYTVFSPDVLATHGGSVVAMTYTGGATAAIQSGNTIVVGFPFECINEEAARHALFQGVLDHILPGYTGINTGGGGGGGTGSGKKKRSSGSEGCALSPVTASPFVLGLLALWTRRRKRAG